MWSRCPECKESGLTFWRLSFNYALIFSIPLIYIDAFIVLSIYRLFDRTNAFYFRHMFFFPFRLLLSIHFPCSRATLHHHTKYDYLFLARVTLPSFIIFLNSSFKDVARLSKVIHILRKTLKKCARLSWQCFLYKAESASLCHVSVELFVSVSVDLKDPMLVAGKVPIGPLRKEVGLLLWAQSA